MAFKHKFGMGGPFDDTAGIVVNPPTNLQGVGSFPPAQVDLTWDAPVGSDNDIARYEIWRNDVQLGSTSLTSYVDDDGALASDLSYKYAVLAIDDRNVRSELSVHTNVAIPNLVLLDAPGNLHSSQAGTTVALGWDAVLQGGASFVVDSYNIYRDGVLVGSSPAGDETYLDTPVMVHGETIVYSVAPVDTAGNEGGVSDVSQLIYIPLSIGMQLTVGRGGAGALGYINGNFGLLVPAAIDDNTVNFMRVFTGLNSHIDMTGGLKIRTLNTIYWRLDGLAEILTMTWNDPNAEYQNASSQALFDFLAAREGQVVNIQISEEDIEYVTYNGILVTNNGYPVKVGV